MIGSTGEWKNLVRAVLPHDNLPPVPVQLTLTVLRALPLTNGVSPITPMLWCFASIYLWAVFRMSRLFTMHGVSRMSSNDRVSDLVSTPLRTILYPDHPGDNDEGFTQQERRLVNAVWRPLTGWTWLVSASLLLVPALLLVLKPPSTLEGESGTRALFVGLSLATVLIGATLIQFIRYWLALKALLDRIATHPIAE
ncbi:MAG TPA: hypothetical protein VMF89_04990, partial [Polyangiales bacterium]|nr:hypothetical protein [Polyangiales bacterium]